MQCWLENSDEDADKLDGILHRFCGFLHFRLCYQSFLTTRSFGSWMLQRHLLISSRVRYLPTLADLPLKIWMVLREWDNKLQLDPQRHLGMNLADLFQLLYVHILTCMYDNRHLAQTCSLKPKIQKPENCSYRLQKWHHVTHNLKSCDSENIFLKAVPREIFHLEPEKSSERRYFVLCITWCHFNIIFLLHFLRFQRKRFNKVSF